MTSKRDLENLWYFRNCCRCPNMVHELYFMCIECDSYSVICQTCHEINPFCTKCFRLSRRCGIIEYMYKCLPVPCPNEDNGCKVVMRGLDVHEHKKVCSYVTFRCPLPACSTMITNGTFYEHVIECHTPYIIPYEISVEQRVMVTCFSDRKHIILICLDSNEVFLYQIYYCVLTDKTCHSVQYVGSAEEASKYKYELSINSSGTKEHFVRRLEPIDMAPEVLALTGNCVYSDGKVWNDSSKDIRITISRFDGPHEAKE